MLLFKIPVEKFFRVFAERGESEAERGRTGGRHAETLRRCELACLHEREAHVSLLRSSVVKIKWDSKWGRKKIAMAREVKNGREEGNSKTSETREKKIKESEERKKKVKCT